MPGVGPGGMKELTKRPNSDFDMREQREREKGDRLQRDLERERERDRDAERYHVQQVMHGRGSHPHVHGAPASDAEAARVSPCGIGMPE